MLAGGAGLPTLAYLTDMDQPLASAAGNALGLEAEASSNEDREFEGAKQFVRLAADTVNRAAQARGNGDPRAIAQAAASAAARQFAPGLLGRPGGQVATQNGSGAGAMAPAGARGQGGMRPASGRWARQGHKIVLYGV